MRHHPINRMLNQMCAPLRIDSWVNRPGLSCRIPGSLSRLGFLLSILIPMCNLCQASDLAQQGLIRRDLYGVPHILADTEEAAAFAHGYATAEDHFLEMARLFLRARGERASVFGPSAINEDILVHRLRIWETARDRFKDIPPLMRMILDAYAAGYNLYLSAQRNQKNAPDWAMPITGVDVLAHCRAVLLLDFSLNLKPWRITADRIPEFGSTMWAIGRPRSRSTHGILLANPHLRWEGSHLFHEVQLTVPGKLNVAGAALIGFPVVTIGFNDRLGWAHTVNQRHSEAVYELKLNPSNRSEYFYDGGLLPLRQETFTLRVKTDAKIETRTESAMWAHYGPIIRVAGDRAYAYKSTNLDSINFLTQYNQMAKARSWREFRHALDMQELTMFNLAYTDREGNIFYLYNGRIPVKPDGYDWMRAVPGDNSRAEWYTIHPIARLPQLFNPPSGYLQNCNDAPWYSTMPVSIDRRQYPDYDGDQELGLRGQLSIRLLGAGRSLTLEDVKRFKYHDRLLLADRLKPELISLVRKRVKARTGLAEAVEVLKRWDNRAAADSRGAVLFVQWWEDYRRHVSSPFRVQWSAQRPLDTPGGIRDSSAAISALISAMATVKKSYARLAVAWGEVHRLRRGQLDLPASGLSGMGSLVPIVYRRDTDNKMIGVAGDSYILAVEFTKVPTAYSVMAYSQSSISGSRHYNDQLSLMAEKSYKRLWISEPDICANLERAYRPGQ